MERLHENPIVSPYGCRAVEHLTVPERLFKIEKQNIDLEITEMCRTDCPACYTAGRARLHGAHLPLEVISRRIDWIARHTDARLITLLGGEALLHPDLERVVHSITQAGFRVDLITSCVTSTGNKIEQENIAFLLKKYEAGELGLYLSYHPGRNEKHFKRVFTALKSLAATRRQALEGQKKSVESALKQIASSPEDHQTESLLDELDRLNKDLDANKPLYTTVTIGPKVATDEQKFIAIYRFLFEECLGWDFAKEMTVDNQEVNFYGHIHNEFELLKKHFAPFGSSAYFNRVMNVTLDESGIWQIRLWGAIGVQREVKGGRQIIRVKRPMGNDGSASACPAMTSSTDTNSKEVNLDGALVRSDGELVLPQPGCIEMKYGFANVDHDVDPDAVYQRAASRLAAIDKLIHKIDELHQSERPTAEKGCVSCPFDIACNLCVNNGPVRVVPK